MIRADFTSITQTARTLSLVLSRLMALAIFLSYTIYIPYHLASEPHSQHFGEAATHPMDQSGSAGTDSSSDHRHVSLDHSFQVALKKPVKLEPLQTIALTLPASLAPPMPPSFSIVRQTACTPRSIFYEAEDPHQPRAPPALS